MQNKKFKTDMDELMMKNKTLIEQLQFRDELLQSLENDTERSNARKQYNQSCLAFSNSISNKMIAEANAEVEQSKKMVQQAQARTNEANKIAAEAEARAKQANKIAAEAEANCSKLNAILEQLKNLVETGLATGSKRKRED